MTALSSLPLDPIWDQRERVAALDAFRVLDTPREIEFDDLVTLASAACEAPIAVINLIGDRRQWFKAEVGPGVRQTGLEVSLCARAVLRPGLVVIPDLQGEDCFAGNPLLSGQDGLRFYAGVGLVTSDGFILGSLCVIDRKPRPDGLNDAQAATLLALARQVMSQLELRRLLAQRDEVLDRQLQLEQARAESDEALRRLTQDLERRVQVEVAAREQAQAKLAHAHRLEALGQLASGISYDFNNVLQAASGALRLIQNRIGNRDAVERMSQLGLDAVDRGAAITSRLLTFARQGELRVTAIDPDALLEQLGGVLSHTLNGITVAIERTPGLPLLLVDRSQLETVLINLAVNARDAMPNGGTLSLSVSCVESLLELPPELQADRVGPGRSFIRIAVRDTGFGMDAETLARSSEPFFTTKERGRGTGLGLSMARGFIEQSGGALSIASAPGEGTCVSIWLPCATEDMVQPVPETTARGEDTRRAASGTILLVDDDVTVCGVLAAELAGQGFAVRPFNSAAAAIQALADGMEVDLLVTDLAMPGQDGVALIHAARRLRPALPAILVTGYVGDGVAVALGDMLAGSVTLLRKPISGIDIADCANALLEAARQPA